MRPSLVGRWIASSPLRLGVAALAAGACSSSSSPPTGYCTAARIPAVIVHVTDSVTAAPLAQTASGVVVEGALVDSLRYYGPALDQMEGGSASGTYTVRVAHVGYADWTTANVLVTRSDFCGEPNTVSLVVRLVRTP